MARDTRRDEGQYYPYGKRVLPPSQGGGGDVKHSDFDGVEPLPERFNDEDVRTRFNQLVSAAKGASAAVVVMLLGATAFGAGVTVQTAPKGRIYNDEQIVTNVVFDATGLATTQEVGSVRVELGSVSNDVAALSDSVKTNAAAIATLADTAAALSDSVKTNAAAIATLANATAALSDSVETNAADIATLANATAALSDSVVTGISNLSTRVDGKVEQTDFDAATNSIACTIAPLAGIPALIPAQASPTNQLADKQFVNSSIATSTANFCGTSAATNEDAFVEWLEAIEVANDNDYVFWQTEDGDGNAVFKRYKYVEDPSGLSEEALAGHWLFEYDLNNSSFTAVQWAAINSGVTPEAVAKIANAATKAEAEALRNDKLDKSAVVSPSPSATAGQAADAKATGDALEPLLFAQYYPDGSVKSAAEFTLGIKYDAPDTTHRTITVKPFCNTGDSDNDNSSLEGRVVIPPFVDGDGNGYISDDGTRFKVVGVSDGTQNDENFMLTAIVAPNTVATIGGEALARCTSLTSVSLPAAQSIGVNGLRRCTSLTSVSLPAAQSIGNSVFYDCTSLTSVDFGDMPRPSVPSLGSDAFESVPTTCKIIVPYTQYDAWIAADGWKDLPQEFVRHAEKADKPATFTEGNLAEFDSQGNPTDSHKKPSDFANATSVYTKAEMDAQLGRRGVDIPAGRTDVDAHGCVHNAPVELGLDAKATADLSGLSSNATVRSVSVAIGNGADASNPDNPALQQGIAVGNQARAKGTNAIAIGAGVRHEDEDDLTGDNVYAGANEAIAGGYSAKATASKAVAWGSRAKAHAPGAWQLGEGVNSNRNTLAFRDYQLLGEDGQVPYERVAGAVAQAGVEFEVALSNAVRRILAGGNMAVVGDGSDGEQILEPKVGGLSEVEFVPNTNGQYEASTLVYLDPPPQAARNYDILISEIPEPMWLGTNGWETVALENRLRVGFTDLPPQYDVSMHVDESCGFQRSGRAVSITNAPTVVKLREISTNKVLVVVKPYRLEDL